MEKLNENQIKKLRNILAEELKEYKGEKHIKLDISSDILEQILFETFSDGSREYLFKCFPIWKLDLSDVSFDNVNIRNKNFTGSKGVKINPQTVWEKNLSEASLDGVQIIGNFDDCRIGKTNFSGSVGAVINPQTIYDKYLYGAILKDVTFNGSFDDCDIRRANFSGSKGAKINPQTIYGKSLSRAVLADVTFNGPFDGCAIKGANFTGSKGAVINPQTVEKCCHSGTSYKVCPILEKTVLTDAIITGSFDGCYTKDIVFDGADLSQGVDQIKEQIREQVRKRTL